MLIIARHARSEANMGWTDHPDSNITGDGKLQAEFLGGYLQEIITNISGYQHNPFDRVNIWHSEYKRTKQTAEIVAKTILLDSYGFIEPVVFEDVRIGEYRKEVYVNDMYPPETDEELVDRLNQFLDDVMPTQYPTIVISHGMPILTMTNILQGINKALHWEEPRKVNNCESFLYL